LPHFALSNNLLQAWLKEWYKTGVIRSYLPAIVFLILGGAIGGLFGTLNLLTGKRNRRREVSKHDPYECGLPSEVQRGFRFGISFYMIAMLFILFDIEVIFIYPIAVQLRAFGTFALSETIVFVILLMIAFGYVWRRGALEWK
jgi:NADH-quinone oxidoreductase subunit A